MATKWLSKGPVNRPITNTQPESLVITTQYQVLRTMSFPRSNYDPRRVCLNPFPDLNLGKYRRTIGIYLAGALVSSSLPCVLLLNPRQIAIFQCPPVAHHIVRLGQLDILRCCHPICSRPFSLWRSSDPPSRTRNFCRLGSRHLLAHRNAYHQPH